MRSERFDWWNDEYPEKEAAFQALLRLAKELKRQPTISDVLNDERMAEHQSAFVACWGSVRGACRAVGTYLRSHPQEAVGMDESLWRDGEYTVRYIPVAERLSTKRDKNGAAVSIWRSRGYKRPPRQVEVKPVAGANETKVNENADQHKSEIQKQVTRQVLEAAMIAAAQEVKKVQGQGGSSMSAARRYSDHDILVGIRKYYWENGCFPTQTAMGRDPDMPTYMIVRSRIGNKSEWSAALEREFGPDWMKKPLEEDEPAEPEGEVGVAEAGLAAEPEGADAEVTEEVGMTEAALHVRLIGLYEIEVIVDGKKMTLKIDFGEV